MQHYSLYRPLLLLLIPCAALQLVAAFALFVGVQLLHLGILILAAGLLLLSVAWNYGWSCVRYDFYGLTAYHDRYLSPILVSRTGWLSQNEEYIPLTLLSRVVVQRPLRWRWCRGFYITLHFVTGDTLDLKLVSAPEEWITRLCTELVLPQSPPMALAADSRSLYGVG